MSESLDDDILRSLRRITRAIDLHSRQLATTYGLTGPQLVCLRAIGSAKTTTPGALAQEVSLSQATITGIIDRLTARQLVHRQRSETDRRVVTVALTAAGHALIAAAPSPLQERFAARLGKLPRSEQRVIRDTLRKIVSMMDGDALEAAPMLAADGADTAVVDASIDAPLHPDRATSPGRRPRRSTPQPNRPAAKPKGAPTQRRRGRPLA